MNVNGMSRNTMNGNDMTVMNENAVTGNDMIRMSKNSETRNDVIGMSKNGETGNDMIRMSEIDMREYGHDRWCKDRSGSLLLIILILMGKARCSLGLVGIQQGPMLQQFPNLQLDHGLHTRRPSCISLWLTASYRTTFRLSDYCLFCSSHPSSPPLVASVIVPRLNAVPLKSWHCINISPISEFDQDVEWVLRLRQWEVLAACKSKPTRHKGAPYHIFLMFKAEGRHNACREYLRNEWSRYSLTGVEDYIWEKPLQNFGGVVDIFYINCVYAHASSEEEVSQLLAVGPPTLNRESSLGQIILDYECTCWFCDLLDALSGDDDSGSHQWNGYWQPSEVALPGANLADYRRHDGG
ncbi:hypothetical protein BS47DRAFT_1368284 [Hydnum rufescens UP504]|uniref:Uncharacterized protein n=1 Tax=Hydnum rufescens UP504 TaxID=1448309 RepID=A0A9P6AG85_9AGAM|nr:hypothetical protein BS47DRAFT_1368284 [Hydnum rufescens UP504]